ncbi:HAMP domain-containing sensor histidine kinase [Cryobacterium sp. PAMC25264]|uniref:HAMP domain-containing sensor histidine kinase n=1 Tax=Cryobacterium sp. PAMC25264 TaxID=2861288 RepID=UPI001C62656A|nr:HAMP domain-containing sensor histidine kinase [Cryobacterium sp. PAMC25264]QYF74109.1 HAMP domain-containing histidine kinase [Cryobacterium sp. PAMC25264]
MNRLRRIWLPALSIRARITVGSLLVATVLFSTAAFFFRLEVQSILTATNETMLRNDAEPLIGELAANPTEAIESPSEGQLLAIIDPDGVVRKSSLPRSLDRQITALSDLGPDPQTVNTPAATYLVSATTVTVPSGDWLVIAARSQQAPTLLLDELTGVLTLGTLILTIGFGLASWLLTGAALRPVTRLREEAESLSATGSSARLRVPAGKDEVSRLARTLNDFIERLRRGVDREKQIVSDASHELRTPLAVLQAQLELAHLDSGDAPALERDIRDASATAGRLSRLATNLLELSKLESEQTPPETDWPGLVGEVTASVDRARIVREGHELEVVYRIDGDDPVGYYGISSTNMGQLLDNLISNAVTAMSGHGSVTVSLSRSGVGALITVVDTGPGLPDEFIPLAFDRFSRPDSSRSSHSGGSGLGLAIVHAIVERANGTVQLRNTGAGLAVEIRLPRHIR